MKLDDLLKIRNEIERFDKVLNDCIKLGRETEGWTGSDGVIYGKNDIHNTYQSGHLKREYLSLKFNLNKLI